MSDFTQLYAQALAEIRALSDRTGTGYVPAERRPSAWRCMAEDLAARGRPVPEIAAALCVSEDTVRALLDRPSRDAAGQSLREAA